MGNPFNNINLRLPKRFEIFLLVMVALTLFLTDVNVNKVSDLGVSYQVTVFGNWQPLAVNVFVFGLVIYHLFLIALIFRALIDRGTHLFYDSIVGGIVLFGTYIVVSMAVLQMQGIDTLSFWKISVINFYHIGITIQISGLIYYSLTD
tara:strand:- start:608 stop:1051 length:444 start_codon:yes stop_codon:yes gene_type:complete